MNVPVAKSKVANVVPFPNGISSGPDSSESDSGKSKSTGQEIQSAHKEIPPSEIPYEVKKQPILTDQLLWDLDDLTDMQLRKAYPSEAGTHGSRQTSLRKKGLEYPPEFKKFRAFLRIVGINPHPGPKGYSLHRIDNDNPMYAPGLVKWASKKEQNNAKGDSISLTIDGVTKPLTEWAVKTDQKADTLRKRLKKGWTHRDVVYGRKKTHEQHSTVNAIDCTPDALGPLAKSSDKIPHSPFVTPESDHYTDLFKVAFEDTYGEKVVGTINAHKYMLRRVAKEISKADAPEFKAMRLVIRNWPEFTAYADKQYGFFNPPLKPTPEYMTRAIRAIPSFYNTHYKSLMKLRKENDPKVWSKLLRGYGKKFRKQTEKEYMATRKKKDGIIESRTAWLHNYAQANHTALEQSLSSNWGNPSPDEKYQYDQWHEVIKRTSAMLGVHSQP